MAAVIDVPRHAAILCASYRHWTGKDLIPAKLDGQAVAQWLEKASFAVVSHGTETDPIFNYANPTALQLFGMTLEQFTRLPSRLSAGPMDQDQRAQVMEQVSRNGYIAGYMGIRIAMDGRRFEIRNTTVWNLLDEQGQYYGQAAMIPEWSPVPG